MKIFLPIFFIVFAQTCLKSQNTDSTTFKIDAEFRPRTELRNGYRQLRNDTTKLAFFTSQRTRLNVGFQHTKYALYLSLQDVRVWGESDPRSNKSTFGLFEGYAEWYLKHNLTIRAGRQRLVYDNQRLFALNDWRQTSASHDGVNIKYKSNRFQTELSAFFNQTAEQVFGTSFAPAGFSNYKFLGVHFLQAKLPKDFTITTLNAVDGYQDAAKTEKIHFRATSGGRLEYTKPNWYFTLAGYYQYGELQGGQKISAFYFQPEVKYTPNKKFFARLGAEIMSGQDATATGNSTSNSFVPLYGVAHRFNGYMDLYTSFPADLNNAGLIDPYLFLQYQIAPKISLRSDWHLFFAENKFVKNGTVINKYLGPENDWLFGYALNEATQIEYGFSWLIPTESTIAIKKSGNAGMFNYWTYLMVTFKPTLFKKK